MIFNTEPSYDYIDDFEFEMYFYEYIYMNEEMSKLITCDLPPFHLCSPPPVQGPAEADIPFWSLTGSFFIDELYRFIMIYNLNENFDSFNEDDLDSGDYSYLIDTYSSMDDYDEEEISTYF